MTWENFYLLCFSVGFFLSLISFLAGGLHAVHLPHFPHVHFGGHDLHMVHGDAGHSGHAGDGDVPWINFGTVAAFLAWFGGSGFLLTRHSSIWFLLALGIATVCGLAGAACVFAFLAKLVAEEDKEEDLADYEMVGVLGKIGSVIRAGGTGEIVYSQGGTRHCAGARSEDGTAIPKGTEVIVTRYEKGIAYVRRWEEMTNPELD
jgi:membrane protein implicated in regulation of membrane protease activity